MGKMSCTGSTPQSVAELKVVVKWQQQRWADGRTWWISTHWSWRCACMPKDILSSQPLQRCDCDCFAGCLPHKTRQQFNFIERCKQVCELHLWLTCEFVKLYLPTVWKLLKWAAGRSRRPRAQHHSGTNARICMKPGFYISFTESGTLRHYYTDMVSYVSVSGGDGERLSWLPRQINVVGHHKSSVCWSKEHISNMPQKMSIRKETWRSFHKCLSR